LQVGTYFCAAAVWWVALWRNGQKQRYVTMVPLGVAQLFTDQALPTGGIGGTLLVVTSLTRRGVPKGIAMAALLVGMTSYYGAYLLAVLIALGLLVARGVINGWMIAGAAGFVVIAFGIPSAVLMVRRWAKIWPFTLLMKIGGLATLIEAMESAPTKALRDPVALSLASVLQFGVFVCDAATLWVMLQAIGSGASPAVAFAGFVMASMAATVGPMPLGVGTFEGVSVAALHLLGIEVAPALTATLLLRGFTFWLPMVPGLILARHEVGRDAKK
jgi:hypothetical protein